MIKARDFFSCPGFTFLAKFSSPHLRNIQRFHWKQLSSLKMSTPNSNSIVIASNGKSELKHEASLKNMKDLSTHDLQNFMENINTVMFDCDGVIWLGEQVMPKAVELVKKLRRMGKRVFFLTNNGTKTRTEFVAKFQRLGFETVLEEVVSTSYLAALYLKELNFKQKVYTIGTKGITEELRSVGIESLPIGPDSITDTGIHWYFSKEVQDFKVDPDVGAVIVGFDEFFSYLKMFKAASFLQNKNTIFIATNTDEQFPREGSSFVIPGTGSIVNAVKTAAGREPIILGKPCSPMFDFVQRTYKVEPKKTLMIGDRGNTDILFGTRFGLWTLLVLSGITKLREANEWLSSESEEERGSVPNFYVKDVEEFFNLINVGNDS